MNRSQFYNSPGLAIETSGRCGSTALVLQGTVVTEEVFPHGLKHAAELLPMIDRMLRSNALKPGDLENLFVSEGPGSFTGLRIGVTLAKALTLATSVKLVAVPTLRVLSMNAAAGARQVIVILDAKRDQIFTARFERVADMWVEREPAHLDSLASMVERSPRPVHLLGEGLPFHEKFLPADREGIILTPADCWRARASAVAEIGMELAAAGRFTDPDRFVPLYVRKPEAEEKWEKLNAE
jgi:tRNA threonylcarbamoyladenosine biosynthesis protein TsaB